MAAQEKRLDAADIEVTGPDGLSVPMRTLYHDVSAERELRIVVTPDRMRVYIRHIPGALFSGISREAIVELLHGLGVVSGLIDPGLNLFVSMQNSPTPLDCFVEIARGEPPRKGEDATVEFHVQPTSYEARYDVADDGQIDYKQLNLIENCFVGQRVATVIPPGPGRPGSDVFGMVVPPISGSHVVLNPGRGIVVSANGREYTSEMEGRLVYEHNVLSVNGTLEITRDIDLSVGNVDFVGRVVVKGSLLDGFYINAKRGVEISGDMGAARITSEGDVKIAGGVKGKSVAAIACRDLNAHYIDDATVEATGDVLVTKEIMSSSVQAIGRVVVSNGAIIGGVVCGFRGVEADTIGSDMGVSTRIVSGLDWTAENKKADIRARVAEYLDRIQSSGVLLEPLFNDSEIAGRLGTDQKSMLSELIAELRDIREHLVELLDERAAIGGHRQEGMTDQVNVKKIVHMGVQVRFSQVDGEVKDAIKGPLSLTPDSTSGAMRFGAFSDLPEYKLLEKADGDGGDGAPTEANADGEG